MLVVSAYARPLIACLARLLFWMKSQMKAALACVISFIWIQYSLCDVLPDSSSGNKWTCTCFSAYGGNQSAAHIPSCASSCNCSYATKRSEGYKWVCLCTWDELPRMSTDADHGTECFTSCNCKSGSTGGAVPTEKRESSKFLVLILLFSVVVTALVFVGLFVCYVYHRDKYPFSQHLSLSDKGTSYNSASHLISHNATSLPEFKVYISSPATRNTGCFQKTSLLFRNRTEVIYGTLVRFSYSELEKATNKFSSSNLIGIGGSSHVYLGHLKDGTEFAIKRMKAEREIGVENDFMTEIELISRLHHRHVVHLLGFCLENQGKHMERLLIFEYMLKGNLRERLDEATEEFLDWRTRVCIALGAAKGLEYLHEAAAPRIMHRDVKSTNILLDEKWRAKISDLGMAKRLRNDGLSSPSSSPARMQGTFGYFAPEYAMAGRGSLKSDVFSFGVVLLELITGRQPIQKSAGKEESLVIWATLRLLDRERVLLEFPDPKLQGNYPAEEIQIMAYLAKECLLLDPDSRPSMSEVVQILSSIVSGKSGGRNFSFNHIQPQSSSTPAIENEPDIEMPVKQTQISTEAEELRRFTSDQSPPPRCSLPSEKNVKKHLLHTSTRNISSEAEEAVDIVEPQFESFSVAHSSETLELHVSSRQKQLLRTQ
ncbi:receptor-like serine/threonine-protein kinase NCRK isoform X2 [Daucus carota subsp. sativus]|uniref:receptor-like serine/threonine-protein kinase NCRK isoform X2 n=1 Tax=Daucus carota subsp. sativus TaxID=79200 RepID=UPI0007EFE69B|nr:PREDICTED: receptor-like serine/threonine-protein kinase NCRK isoform X2 [Daucus carota subsp. sativus]